MNRITHFEFPVDDADRAASFYTKAFGWQIAKWDGPQDYWLIKTGPDDQPGIDGALTPRSEGAMTISNVLDVADVDAASEQVVAAGGVIVLPKMAVPGIGYVAYFRDTEGNVLGMMQDDMNAK